MPSFFVNRSLSRGDLTLFLTNGEGLPQDGYDVRWTVYRQDGRAASGLSVPATKASAGEYFAPWGCAKVGGCYSIKWEYSAGPGQNRQSWCQGFFVLEGSGGCCSRSTAPAGTGASIDCGAFFRGQVLGPGDLCIQIVDDDDLPTAAFLVFWTILDCRGCPVTPRTQAVAGAALGTYCVSWVPGCTGSFKVRWEWMVDEDSPMESKCDVFSIVNPPALFSRCWVSTSDACAPCSPPAAFCPPAAVASPCEVPVIRSNFCPPSPPPNVIVVKECPGGPAVIPRTVVLGSQVLPVGGAFTNQAAYAFSSAIRHMTFYIRYTQGLTGGFPVLRLMWGNGFEEIASTSINASFSSFDGRVAAQEMRISDLLGPVPNSDEPEFFMLETSVPGGSTTVRLLMAEGGQIGVPGTAEITLTGSSD